MDAAGEHIEQLATLTKAKAFLSREFLTWLWYVAETSHERLRLRIAGAELEVDVWMDDRLVLAGTASMSHQNVMKGGDPSRSREAAASLATGKTVREVKFGISVKNGGDYSAILGCDDLNPRSLKLPLPDAPDGEGQKVAALPLTDRLQATATFLGILDALFARFIALRVDPTWEGDGLAAMRDWIKKRQSKQDSATIH